MKKIERPKNTCCRVPQEDTEKNKPDILNQEEVIEFVIGRKRKNKKKHSQQLKQLPSLEVLSDSMMSDVAYQIGNVEKIDENPLSLCILWFFNTCDARQQHMLFGHIERCISGEVTDEIARNN